MTFANDTVTEQDLIRLEVIAQRTIDRLTAAQDAARRIRDAAQAAQTRRLTDENLAKIKTESLRLASSLFFARENGDLVTDIVGKIDKHREGQS